MVSPEEILNFWLDETGPEGWYGGGEALDQEIRDRFGAAWEAAMDGAYGLWLTYPSGALAYLILVDQFPRNMFRGEGKAFSSDPLALAVAKRAIDRGWDLKIDEPARQFFYLPLMHSESLTDQDRCVRLIAERMEAEANLLHAKAHREVIRKFGRFPYRNEALSRRATAGEKAYLDEGGYGSTVRALEGAA
jgi:uncharacterized protein (DUF924 family)